MLQLPAGLGVKKSLKCYVYYENGASGGHKLLKRYIYNKNGAFGGQKSPKQYIYNENGDVGGVVCIRVRKPSRFRVPEWGTIPWGGALCTEYWLIYIYILFLLFLFLLLYVF